MFCNLILEVYLGFVGIELPDASLNSWFIKFPSNETMKISCFSFSHSIDLLSACNGAGIVIYKGDQNKNGTCPSVA
jgi:hypothetical protein